MLTVVCEVILRVGADHMVHDDVGVHVHVMRMEGIHRREEFCPRSVEGGNRTLLVELCQVVAVVDLVPDVASAHPFLVNGGIDPNGGEAGGLNFGCLRFQALPLRAGGGCLRHVSVEGSEHHTVAHRRRGEGSNNCCRTGWVPR